MKCRWKLVFKPECEERFQESSTYENLPVDMTCGCGKQIEHDKSDSEKIMDIYAQQQQEMSDELAAARAEIATLRGNLAQAGRTLMVLPAREEFDRVVAEADAARAEIERLKAKLEGEIGQRKEITAGYDAVDEAKSERIREREADLATGRRLCNTPWETSPNDPLRMIRHGQKIAAWAKGEDAELEARPALDRARLVEALRAFIQTGRPTIRNGAEVTLTTWDCVAGADAILRHLAGSEQPAAEPAKPRRMPACPNYKEWPCRMCPCREEHDESANCHHASGCPACVPVAADEKGEGER
jgi:BMFP domain-containing protein YqiC